MTLQRNQWRRHAPAAGVIAVGVIASVVVFLMLRSAHRERMRADFAELTNKRTAVFERDLHEHLEILSSIARLYAANRDVSRDEFHAFVSPSLERHSEVTALEWMPRVLDAERADYENRARADGLTDFQIRERDAAGGLVVAGRRAEYFPVYFTEPLEHNRAALGLDRGAFADRRATMAAARDKGQPMATEQVQLQRGGQGMLVFLPVYRKGAVVETVEQRRAGLLGFAAMVFNVGTVFEETLAGERTAGNDIQFFDESAAPENRLLHTHWSRRRAAGERELPVLNLEQVERFEFAGRQWSAISRPAPEFLADYQSAAASVALAVGLLFTGLLGAFAFREASRGLKLAVAHAALGESEQRYRSLVEVSPDAVFVNRENQIVFINAAGLKLLGATDPAQVLGRSPLDFFHPDFHPLIQERIRVLREKKQPAPLAENKLLRLDGAVVPVETTAVPFEDRGVTSIQVVVRDITERKRAEAALREREARLHEAQRIGQMGSWQLDLVANRLAWSDEIFRIFEIDPQQFGASYEAFLQAVHPDDREMVNRAYAESVRNRTPYAIAHRLQMPDGRIKFVQERCETVYDATGRPLRSLGTVQDITKRKRAEEELARHREHLEELVSERTRDLAAARTAALSLMQDAQQQQQRATEALAALREGEERFRVAQELSLDAFTILTAVRDAGGAIVDFRWAYANPEAGRILRHPPAELVGRRLLELLPGNRTQSDLFTRYVRVAETGQPHDYELPYQSEGIAGWFRNMAVKLGDGVAICFADITARKQTEEALREANEALERRADELDEFNQAMVGREKRIIQMKEEVNALCRELGREPEYPPVWEGKP